VLRGQDTSLLAPEETPEEVLREREARAAAVSAVQDKLRAASGETRTGVHTQPLSTIQIAKTLLSSVLYKTSCAQPRQVRAKRALSR
jgi:hypothetical protein